MVLMQNEMMNRIIHYCLVKAIMYCLFYREQDFYGYPQNASVALLSRMGVVNNTIVCLDVAGLEKISL
jgi:hypothetical protein